MLKIFIKEKNDFLQLAQDAQPSFTKDNDLFLFGETQDDRTTELAVPATKHNLTVLGFADMTNVYGEETRKKYNAQLYYNSSIFNGTLHITDFNNNDNCFNVVFTFEQHDIWKLLDTLELKFACRPYDVDSQFVIIDNITNIIQSAKASSNVFAKFRYFSNAPSGAPDTVGVLPAYNVAHMITYINRFLTEIGANITIDNTIFTDLLYLPNTLYSFKKAGWVNYKRNNFQYVADYFYPGFRPGYVPRNVGRDNPNPIKVDFLDTDGTFKADQEVLGCPSSLPEGPFGPYVFFPYLKAKKDCTITFPFDTPDDIFMRMLPTPDLAEHHQYDWKYYFYGEYWFDLEDNNATPQGTPLKGKTVYVKAGESFSFCKISDWRGAGTPTQEEPYIVIDSGYYRNALGWKINTDPFAFASYIDDINVPFYVETDITVKADYTVIANEADHLTNKNYASFSACLPDKSVAEFLKECIYIKSAISYIDPDTNILKIVSPTNIKQFFDLNNITVYNIDGNAVVHAPLLHINLLTRTFADFKQNNIVSYGPMPTPTSPFPTISPISPISPDTSSSTLINYTIDNQALDTENEIYTTDARPTDKDDEYTECALVLYDDLENRENYGATFLKLVDITPIPQYNVNALYQPLERKNVILSALCESSTKIEVEVCMSSFQYSKIKYNTLFYLKNNYWTWTNITFEENVATLTLQKITL